jgi:hypothetical protein
MLTTLEFALSKREALVANSLAQREALSQPILYHSITVLFIGNVD